MTFNYAFVYTYAVADKAFVQWISGDYPLLLVAEDINLRIFELLSRCSRQRQRLSASILFVCLFVAKMQKNAIFSKTKQFRAMVSIDVL